MEQRPVEAEAREQTGHREADAVLGKKGGLASPHKQAGNQDFPSAGQDGAGSAGLRRKTKDKEF